MNPVNSMKLGHVQKGISQNMNTIQIKKSKLCKD